MFSARELTLSTLHLCPLITWQHIKMLHCLLMLCALLLLLLKENSSYQWHWLASTLSPYYEGNSLQDMVEDDRFIAQTSDCWYFGADSTGDIFSSDFIESLASECTNRELHSVHLVCIFLYFLLCHAVIYLHIYASLA